MARTDDETILREAQSLPPDEQRRIDALRRSPGARVLDTVTLKTLLDQGLAQPRALTAAEQTAIDTWFAKSEELALQIGTSWIDPSVSAVDAVCEQRREL